MIKIILLLSLIACKTPADIAKSRFPDKWAAYCTTSSSRGVAMCSYKGKAYICWTYNNSGGETAWCVEALDPLYLDADRSRHCPPEKSEVQTILEKNL